MACLFFPAAASGAECTNTWVGSAESTWQTASNWSAGHVPWATDVACIGSGKTAKSSSGTNQAAIVQGEGSIVISGGSLELKRPASEGESTIPVLTMSGSGKLSGPGKLRITKTLNWNSGQMAGTGLTVIASGASGSMTGVALNERTLVNNGTLSLPSSYFSMSNGSRLENSGTFTVNTESTENIVHTVGADPLIVNTGTVRKASGTGTTAIKVGFENRGSVKAETGTLAFSSSEPLTLIASSSLEGSIKASGPTVTAQSFSMPSGILTLTSGTDFSLETGSTASISGLSMTGGALKGAGTVSVSTAFNWSGGTMSGTGSTVLLAEAAGSMSNAYLSERTLVNKGTLALPSGFFSMSNGSKLENLGTFTADTESTEGIVHNTGAVPLILNTGTIRKASGSGETKIKVKLENLGGLKAEAGSIVFPTAAEPVTFGPKSLLAGNIKLQGPAVTAQDFTMSSGTLSLQSGSLSIDSGYVATAAGLTQNGGTLKGAGSLNVSGAFTWTGGSMAGTGTTALLPGGTGTVSNVTINERVLINGGSLSLSGNYLMMRATAVLENTGTLTLNAEGEETGIIHPFAELGALLINGGTIRKSSGSGTTFIKADLANLGTVQAESGMLTFEGSQVALLASGSALIGGVKFQGPDVVAEDVDSTGGTLTVGGMSSLKIGAGSTVQAAHLVLNGPVEGAGNLKVTASLTWAGSTMSGSGRTVLAAAGSGSISEVRLEERTFLNEGTLTLPTKYLQLRDAATFENQGTFNANTEGGELGIVRGGTGADPLFLNTGVFQKTAGTGTTMVEAPFNNSGVIREQSGHLDITDPVKTARTNKFGNRSCSGDPVECATGDFIESQTDIAIGGLGLGLLLTRTYSAQSAAVATSPGAFGYGWASSFSDRLAIEEGGAKVTVVRGDGATIPFTRTSGTAYAGPTWAKEKLSGSPEAGYTFTTVDQAQYRFSGAGRLQSATDRNGNESALSYDEAGRLKTITDPGGRQLTYAYNSGGQVESVTDPMGHVVKYAYDAGNLAAVTLPGEEGPRWQFKYDASHRITQVTDGRGGKTTNEYDGSSRVVSQTDPAGRTLTFEYDSFHTVVTNQATGAITDKWFTSNNEPFEITHGYGTPQATTKSFTYNAAGQIVRETDGNGHATTFGYDEAGNRTSEKDALGHETKRIYNSTHDVISVTTPGGETTTFERDGNGNVESIARPGPGETAQTISYAYDEHGQLESATDPLERTWSFGYDSYGNRTSETDPLGHTSTFEYDGDSRLIATVSPRGNLEGVEASEYETTVERDAQGRPLKITDPLGHSTEYGYDGNGNMVSITDAKGHTTSYTYNPANEQTKIEKANGATLETAYDGAGEVVSQTDANEHTTTYVRDVLEQPVELIDPLGRKTTNGFDDAGNLISTVDPAEREISYSYDTADRLTAIDYSEAATPDASFEYDADSNLVGMSDGSGESSFSYDQLGRLTRSEDGHGEVVEYGYDLADELTGIVYPNGKEVVRAYDGAGRLESVGDWLGGETKFAYDADSNLTAINFPTASGNVDEYSYDSTSLVSEAKFKKGTETLASLTYTRDLLGQVEHEARTGLPGAEELNYGYDEANRLVEAGAESFAYDPADNLTEGIGSTNAYDAASQLETGTGLTYSYDKLGERTKVAPASGPATSYGYDQAGNLISVARPKEGEAPGIAEAMTYDGTGLLASKTSGLMTRHLAWDLSSSLPLLLDDGERSYIYGPDGLPVEQITAKEESTYLHHDQLGSTRILTGQSGDATASFSYAPYGGLEASTGTATTPLGFGGQYTDAETGLQYLRARFYDPATGQFLTRDPIEGQTRQPYSYARQNPLNLVDPSGLVGELAGGGCLVGEAIQPIGGCAPGAAAGATAEVAIAAGAVITAWLAAEAADSDDSASDEPCLEPRVDPWERETQIGSASQERTEDAQFVDKLETSAGSNPESPFGNGPRWKQVAALIARLIAALRREV